MGRPVAGKSATIRMIRFAPFAGVELDDLIEQESRSTPYPWTLKMLQDSVAGTADCNLIYENEKTIGYLIVQPVLDEAELLNIVIFKAFQSRGYGRQAILALHKDMIRRGVARLFLEVRRSNQAARALYAGTGYELVYIRHAYYRDRRLPARAAEDALVMRCPLSKRGLGIS